MDPLISVIIAARNEELHLEKTIASMVSNTGYGNYEIIVINDGSTDKSEQILANLKYPQVKTLKTPGIGTAKARNLGSRFSKGEILVFSDAHITVPPGWLEKIGGACKQAAFDILAVPISPDTDSEPEFQGLLTYGQTLNDKLFYQWNLLKPAPFSEVAVAAGGFVIYKKDVFKAISGYDAGFNTWGYEDIEISVKAWLMGYSTRIITDLTVLHYFRKKAPYQVDGFEHTYNYFRSALLHLKAERVNKVREIIYRTLQATNHDPVAGLALISQKLQASNTLQLREEYFKKRKYSDDWYFAKFAIEF
jgi:glycosyltransferase involved in cell wall biosynthesis